MSCVFYVIMLLIELLFATFGIWLLRKEKQVHREIMELRKKYCSDERAKDEKSVRKQKLLKSEKAYKNWENICFLCFCIVVVITIVLPVRSIIVANRKSIEMKKTVDEILTEMGGQSGIYNPLEILNIDQTTESAVEEKIKDMPLGELYSSLIEDKERERELYVNAASDMMEDYENQTFEMPIMLGQTSTSESTKYESNVEALRKIEEARVPKGYKIDAVQNGIVNPLPISADTSKTEAEMRWECYFIKPDVSMLQQAAKASLDTVIGFSTRSYGIEVMIEHAVYASSGYLCLMRYEKTGESKADCCFWIAKLFRVLADALPKAWKELIEHCEMASYAFCELGVQYMNELDEKNDHAGELLQLYDEMDVRTR